MAIIVGDMTHGPRFVTEAVDGLKGVHRRDPGILQSNDHVLEVLVLCHAECMLAHQHEVWPERPEMVEGEETASHLYRLKQQLKKTQSQAGKPYMGEEMDAKSGGNDLIR